MKIFTRRNAIVGYIALKAMSAGHVRLASRTSRRAWGFGLLFVLGLLSAGLVLGLVIVLRRQRRPRDLRDRAVADEVATSPLVEGEPSPEPAPAA